MGVIRFASLRDFINHFEISRSNIYWHYLVLELELVLVIITQFGAICEEKVRFALILIFRNDTRSFTRVILAFYMRKNILTTCWVILIADQ